jgi:DNA-binding response OmpR family regulator
LTHRKVRRSVFRGLTGLSRIKADPALARISVTFVTARDHLESRLAGFAAGGVDYISKPFYPEEIVARVLIHLDYATLKHNFEERIDAYENRYGVLPGFASGGETHSAEALLVQRARDLLLQDAQNPPSLEELSARLGTNRDRLNKSFQIVFEMPPCRS